MRGASQQNAPAGTPVVQPGIPADTTGVTRGVPAISKTCALHGVYTQIMKAQITYLRPQCPAPPTGRGTLEWAPWTLHWKDRSGSMNIGPINHD